MVDRKKRTTPGSARLDLGLSRTPGLPCRAPDLLGTRCDDLATGRRLAFYPAGRDLDALRAAATARDEHERAVHGLEVAYARGGREVLTRVAPRRWNER